MQNTKNTASRLLQKKIILIVFSVCIVAAIAYADIALYEEGFFTERVSAQGGGILFDPFVDYAYDIFTSNEYQRLLANDPFISLCLDKYGTTESLDPEEYGKKGDAVKLLTDLLLAIQAGDHVKYNSYFSDEYLIAEGKARAELKGIKDELTSEQYREMGLEDGFTMQQVYAAVITVVDEDVNEKTGIVTSHCKLKYKIHRNNATLRSDMGSDCYREQDIVITNDNDYDEYKIKSVTTYSSQTYGERVVAWRVAVAAAVSVLLVAGAVALDIIMIGKWGRVKKDEEETARN